MGEMIDSAMRLRSADFVVRWEQEWDVCAVQAWMQPKQMSYVGNVQCTDHAVYMEGPAVERILSEFPSAIPRRGWGGAYCPGIVDKTTGRWMSGFGLTQSRAIGDI